MSRRFGVSDPAVKPKMIARGLKFQILEVE